MCFHRSSPSKTVGSIIQQKGGTRKPSVPTPNARRPFLPLRFARNGNAPIPPALCCPRDHLRCAYGIGRLPRVPIEFRSAVIRAIGANVKRLGRPRQIGPTLAQQRCSCVSHYVFATGAICSSINQSHRVSKHAWATWPAANGPVVHECAESLEVRELRILWVYRR